MFRVYKVYRVRVQGSGFKGVVFRVYTAYRIRVQGSGFRV